MKIQDDILNYREMCDAEKTQLQRGMNFRLNPGYSVILMSQRSNAPYKDRIHDDGITIEYEGHDVQKNHSDNYKTDDQPEKLPSGGLTQNGKFIKSINDYKKGGKPELVKVYEKIKNGIWSLKGYFDLIDYNVVHEEKRNVFKYILKLSEQNEDSNNDNLNLEHRRLIPSEVKQLVWKRDQGKCVICGSITNLHFDHDLPFSKGGTSLSVNNVRLLCLKCNLTKSDKIE